MPDFLEVFLFIGLAATKLLLAPLAMLTSGYSILKTIIVTYIGALLGATVFYYFGVAIFKWWDDFFGNSKSNKKVFSRKSRSIVEVKIRAGILGLALLAPIISIPISAFVIAKFFPGKHKVVGIYATALIPISIILAFISEPVSTWFQGLFQY